MNNRLIVILIRIPMLRKLEKELKDRARLEFNSTYQQFNDNQDFLYKHSEELNALYDKDSDYKTSRALKVRGVYETYKEAEIRLRLYNAKIDLSRFCWYSWGMVTLGPQPIRFKMKNTWKMNLILLFKNTSKTKSQRYAL